MSLTNATRPSGRRTAFEYVREELRHRILSGAVRGGTHLTQTDVAQELGVSTTPVREAFRQLASDGLVTLDTQRGAVVRQPERADAEEIFALRRLLEPHAAHLAAQRMPDEDIALARQLHEEMEQASAVADWFELNRSFHNVIIDGARSPRLAAMLHGLRDSTAIYTGLTLQTVARPFHLGNEDHARIADALEQRDEAALAAAVLQHLEHTIDLVREALRDDLESDDLEA